MKRITEKLCRTKNTLKNLIEIHNEIIGFGQILQDSYADFDTLCCSKRFGKLETKLSIVVENICTISTFKEFRIQAEINNSDITDWETAKQLDLWMN